MKSFFNRYFFAGLASGIVLTLLTLIGGLFLLGYFLSDRLGEAALPPPPLERGSGKLDTDWVLESLEGQSLRLSDLRGKPVFINIWATWCGPCVVEMPTLEKLYAKTGREVSFLIVSEEERETVSRFVREKGYRLPFYTAVSGMPERLRTRGIPASFILNSQGEVVFEHVGAANWDSSRVLNFLKELSGEQEQITLN